MNLPKNIPNKFVYALARHIAAVGIHDRECILVQYARKNREIPMLIKYHWKARVRQPDRTARALPIIHEL